MYIEYASINMYICIIVVRRHNFWKKNEISAQYNGRAQSESNEPKTLDSKLKIRFY